MQPKNDRTKASAATNDDTRNDLEQVKLSTRVGSKSNAAESRWQGRELGRFQLQAELGRGAFGVVYRAIDPQLVRTVALKLPNFSEFESERQAARFLREARAAANLHHPNIVAVYDAGCIDSQHYIASAFIDGSTLRHVIRNRGKPSPTSAAKLVAKLADALGYAHSAGVIHRDIKPENILIDSQGTPFIADFGLARLDATDNLQTREGTLLGTPAYMSPEQAQGKSQSIDGRADIWSLGVILYELLAGERPFQGNEIQTLYSVIHSEPEPLKGKVPGLPIDLITITEKCLRKELDKRYATAEALRDDLQNWLNDNPITARKSSLVERFLRWRRRNPTIALMSCILLLAITIGTSAVTWQWLRAESMRELSERNEIKAKRLQELAEERSKELTARSLIIDQKNQELEKEKSALQSANDEIANQLKLLTQKDVQLANTNEERSRAEQIAAQESDLRVKETQKNRNLRYLREVYSASLALQARDIATCTQFLNATESAERSLEHTILTQQLKRLKLYEPAVDVVKLPAKERDFFLSSHTPLGISGENFVDVLGARSVSDVSSDGSAILTMQPQFDWFRTFVPPAVDFVRNNLNVNEYLKLPPTYTCKVRDHSSIALNAWLSPDGLSLFVLVPDVKLVKETPASLAYELTAELKVVHLREDREQLLKTFSIGAFSVASISSKDWSFRVSILANSMRFGATSVDSTQFAFCSPDEGTLEVWAKTGSDFVTLKKINTNRVVSTLGQSRPLVYLQNGLALAHTKGVEIYSTSTLEVLAKAKFATSVLPELEVHFSSTKQGVLHIDHKRQSFVVHNIDGGNPVATGEFPPADKQTLVLNELTLQKISNVARPVVDWNSVRFEQAPDNNWFCIRTAGDMPRILVQKRQQTMQNQISILQSSIDDRAKHLAVSRDGEWCAVWADLDLTAFPVTDTERSRPVSMKSTHGAILDASFSLNTNAIAVVAGSHLTMHNVADGSRQEVFQSRDLQRAFPVANSDLVIACDGLGTVQIRDLRSSNNRSVKAQRSGASSVVIDSQSQWMVTGGSELALRRWKFLTGSVDGTVRIESPVAMLKLFEDQKLLACELTDESVLMLRWPTLERICRIPAQTSATLDCQPTPDGKRILVASATKVAIFDVSTSMELMAVTLFPEPVIDAKFLGDGRRVLTLQRRGIVALHQLYE